MTIHEVQNEIILLKNEKRLLTQDKITNDKNLSSLNGALKSLHPKHNKNEYREKEALKQKIKEVLHEINAKIIEINTEIANKVSIINDIQKGIPVRRPSPVDNSKRDYEDLLIMKIVNLKNEYMSFAGDKTRVASMRAMAAEFSEKLDIMIRNPRNYSTK